ncbi:hypothetical protein O0I10_004463 [Lichtheimia ornata]|uniref:Uncharacterized protein n=1 Tax=Lichtheimia ornata TaxID=688661 RepID=A0AAD7XZ90_9FUNG|nr:uncharacterized protein O0I10_004463 [Lichtheimia ornata]KAJ8659870.1 hypothetical protein O0I10_004463 [Lichtheimia ornata]
MFNPTTTMMSSSAGLSPSSPNGNENFNKRSSSSPSETVLDMTGTITPTMSKRRSSSLTREDILSMARVEYARRLSQFTLSQMRKQQQQQVLDGGSSGSDPIITSRDSSGSSGSSGDDSSRHVEQ